MTLESVCKLPHSKDGCKLLILKKKKKKKDFYFAQTKTASMVDTTGCTKNALSRSVFERDSRW